MEALQAVGCAAACSLQGWGSCLSSDAYHFVAMLMRADT